MVGDIVPCGVPNRFHWLSIWTFTEDTEMKLNDFFACALAVLLVLLFFVVGESWMDSQRERNYPHYNSEVQSLGISQETEAHVVGRTAPISMRDEISDEELESLKALVSQRDAPTEEDLLRDAAVYGPEGAESRLRRLRGKMALEKLGEISKTTYRSGRISKRERLARFRAFEDRLIEAGGFGEVPASGIDRLRRFRLFQDSEGVCLENTYESGDPATLPVQRIAGIRWDHSEGEVWFATYDFEKGRYPDYLGAMENVPRVWISINISDVGEKFLREFKVGDNVAFAGLVYDKEVNTHPLVAFPGIPYFAGLNFHTSAIPVKV